MHANFLSPSSGSGGQSQLEATGNSIISYLLTFSLLLQRGNKRSLCGNSKRTHTLKIDCRQQAREFLSLACCRQSIFSVCVLLLLPQRDRLLPRCNKRENVKR